MQELQQNFKQPAALKQGLTPTYAKDATDTLFQDV
jgi:hypothetical protein